MPAQPFVDKLNEQIANEFAAPTSSTSRTPSTTTPRRCRASPRFFYRAGARGARPRDDDGPVPARRRASSRSIPGIEAPQNAIRRHRRAGAARARPGEARHRADQRARRGSPASTATTRRAVHAVVHQGAGRGGRRRCRPARPSSSAPARTRCSPRTTSPARGPAARSADPTAPGGGRRESGPGRRAAKPARSISSRKRPREVMRRDRQPVVHVEPVGGPARLADS